MIIDKEKYTITASFDDLKKEDFTLEEEREGLPELTEALRCAFDYYRRDNELFAELKK